MEASISYKKSAICITSMSYSAKIWASCLKLFILFSVTPRFLFSLWYRIFNYFNTVTTKLINFLGKKKKRN